MHPEINRNFQQQRHSYLLQEARSGHLAAELAKGRRAERRERFMRFLHARRREALVPQTHGV